MITARDLKARTAPYVGLRNLCDEAMSDAANRGVYFVDVKNVAQYYDEEVISDVVRAIKALGYIVYYNEASNAIYISWEDA